MCVQPRFERTFVRIFHPLVIVVTTVSPCPHRVVSICLSSVQALAIRWCMTDKVLELIGKIVNRLYDTISFFSTWFPLELVDVSGTLARQMRGHTAPQLWSKSIDSIFQQGWIKELKSKPTPTSKPTRLRFLLDLEELSAEPNLEEPFQ